LYEKVVRLKGGDIAFFSNVFDELQTAVENNIAYEIVPGIMQHQAHLLIPVFRYGKRDSSGAQLLTYYQTSIINKETWEQLADFKETLVFI
jgi:siroheme synthase